ncbi:HNH endonuclease [Salinisphaera sp. SWV1]|uniref:HNH endonuclease n=1 Tax=Salinisphaera sp. SWV1 TaxID=3454139 RepID=UPI003F872D04
MANYRDLSDRNAVLKAITECDRLGRASFLEKYGYGKALRFVLLHDGKQYDSKAIVGAAYEHQFGKLLRSTDFSGGQASVVPKLASLGFTVVALAITDDTSALSEEVPDSMWEGGKRTVTVNAYERSAEARAACIEAHGSTCAICSFDFGRFYGPDFEGFIHVHHRVPVSHVGERYKVDPTKDLVPLCPNCHAVVHYGNRTRTEDEVRESIRKAKKLLAEG